MAEYRYYLIPDAMTRAFPEQFGKQTPTEFFDNIADLEKRYHQLREMPYNNERTWNERARFPYAADNATDNYLALLSWQAEQYPDSIAAEIVNAPEAYAAPTGKTVYVGTLYTPSNAAWQRFVVLNYTPVVLSGDSEIPGFETGGESVDKSWSASYERSESLDFSYTVNTDKIQLDTLEKVDGAGIEIAPILDGIPADIDGGSWTITPDGMQSVTTSGHTADDNYHLNGGDGSVTWTVHFSVSKSASQSGSITANSEQDADAQASAAQSAAQSACEGQVNGEIEAALSAAHRARKGTPL